MEVIYTCCYGLDVPKKSITACVLWAEAKGKSRKEKKRFVTFTHDLLPLADWLAERGVTHLAMESTGVYWKPVWNILAERTSCSACGKGNGRSTTADHQMTNPRDGWEANFSVASV
jgi:hypothetical protein